MFIFVIFILACVSAYSKCQCLDSVVLAIVNLLIGLREEDHEKSVAFAAMWSVLLAIGVSIAGTIIMRKVGCSLLCVQMLVNYVFLVQYQTDLAIGAFIGVLVVMTNQMLILFAIFVDYAYNAENQSEGDVKTYEAMAAFFFLLFADYFLFVVLLGAFKSVIVENGIHNPLCIFVFLICIFIDRFSS